MRYAIFCVMFLMAQILSWSAQAQCALGATTVPFGSGDLISGSTATATGTVSISCPGGFGSFPFLWVCTSIGVGVNSVSVNNRTMKSGSNTLAYQLYTDSGLTTIYQYTPSNQYSAPYNNSTGGTSNTTVFAKILAGQTSPPGTYTDTYSSAAQEQLSPEPGSYGWRARESEGASFYREASVSYRSSIGTVLGGASQDRSGSRATLELRGSITTMDRDVFLSNWIDDGFAVVSAGMPGLEVRHDNRPVGVTDGRGRLLIPSLRSYQNNRITIDPSNLPIDAEIESTSDSVTPARGAGLLVNFKVRNNTASALVTFVRGDGSFVPAGSVGRIEGGGEFTVGYDGQSFIQNLKRANSAAIEFLDGKCSTSFEFTPKTGEQVQIGPVLCKE